MSDTEQPSTRSVFADRLRLALESAGLRHQDIWEPIGVTARTLLNWLRGDSEPGATHIAQIAKILRVPSDYLLGLVDAPDLRPGYQATIVDDALRRIVAGEHIPTREEIDRIIAWYPRLFFGPVYLPEAASVISIAEGERIRDVIRDIIRTQFPDLFDRWLALNPRGC